MDSIKNMDTMTKRNILGALILTLSLVIIGVSTSYAYFTNGVVEENAGNQGVSVTSDRLKMTFATENNKYIKASAATLMEEATVTSGTNYTEFKIEIPSDATIASGSYSVYLTDITMTENFKSADLKWALFSGDSKVANGDFSGVTITGGKASDVPLISGNISKGAPVTYKLFVWLQRTDANQNNLLNGSLSARVGFSGSSRTN